MSVIGSIGRGISNIGTKIGDVIRGTPNVGKVGYVDNPNAYKNVPTAPSNVIGYDTSGNPVYNTPSTNWKSGGGETSPVPTPSPVPIPVKDTGYTTLSDTPPPGPKTITQLMTPQQQAIAQQNIKQAIAQSQATQSYKTYGGGSVSYYIQPKGYLQEIKNNNTGMVTYRFIEGGQPHTTFTPRVTAEYQQEPTIQEVPAQTIKGYNLPQYQTKLPEQRINLPYQTRGTMVNYVPMSQERIDEINKPFLTSLGELNAKTEPFTGVGILGTPLFVSFKNIKEALGKVSYPITTTSKLSLPYQTRGTSYSESGKFYTPEKIVKSTTDIGFPVRVASELLPTTALGVASTIALPAIWGKLPTIVRAGASSLFGYTGVKGASGEGTPEQKTASALMGGLGALGLAGEVLKVLPKSEIRISRTEYRIAPKEMTYLGTQEPKLIEIGITPKGETVSKYTYDLSGKGRSESLGAKTEITYQSPIRKILGLEPKTVYSGVPYGEGAKGYQKATELLLKTDLTPAQIKETLRYTQPKLIEPSFTGKQEVLFGLGKNSILVSGQTYQVPRIIEQGIKTRLTQPTVDYLSQPSKFIKEFKDVAFYKSYPTIETRFLTPTGEYMKISQIGRTKTTFETLSGAKYLRTGELNFPLNKPININELTTPVYHGTTRTSANRALIEGLLPAKKTGIYRGIAIKPKEVFLTTSKESALGYANRAVAKDILKGSFEKPQVLVVNLPLTQFEKATAKGLGRLGELKVPSVSPKYIEDPLQLKAFRTFETDFYKTKEITRGLIPAGRKITSSSSTIAFIKTGKDPLIITYESPIKISEKLGITKLKSWKDVTFTPEKAKQIIEDVKKIYGTSPTELVPKEIRAKAVPFIELVKAKPLKDILEVIKTPVSKYQGSVYGIPVSVKQLVESNIKPRYNPEAFKDYSLRTPSTSAVFGISSVEGITNLPQDKVYTLSGVEDVLNIKPISSSDLGLQNIEELKPIEITKPVERIKTIEQLKLVERIRVTERLITPQITTPRITTPRITPPTIHKVPKTPPELPPKISQTYPKSRLGMARGRKGLFISEMKRFGKFKPLAVGDIGKVTSLGIKRVKETLGASLRVREVRTGKQVRIPFMSREFRPSKTNPLVIVQREPLRLSARSEVLEIQQSRRKGGMFSLA